MGRQSAWLVDCCAFPRLTSTDLLDNASSVDGAVDGSFPCRKNAQESCATHL